MHPPPVLFEKWKLNSELHSTKEGFECVLENPGSTLINLEVISANVIGLTVTDKQHANHTIFPS